MSAVAESSLEERQKHLLLVVDNLIRERDEWVESDSSTIHPGDELWMAIDETIEIFADGTIPTSCRQIEPRVQDLGKQWEPYRKATEATRNPHAMPGNGFWKAFDQVAEARKSSLGRRRMPLEKLTKLVATEVPNHTICSIFGWIDDFGQIQPEKIDEELEHPGTHLGPDFVPPFERLDQQRSLREQEIATRAQHRLERKIEQAQDVAAATLADLIGQDLSATQIGRMKKITPEEVQRQAESQGLSVPPLHYDDLRTERGKHAPDLSEDERRRLESVLTRPVATKEDPATWKRGQEAADDAEAADELDDLGDDASGGALSVEQEVVQLHRDSGLKPGEIAKSTGMNTQKVSAILKRYKAKPSDFDVPPLT